MSGHDASDRAAPRLVCVGEALIDLVAVETDTPLAEAGTFVRAAGGAPANVAVGAARLGVRSAFLGKVGADPFGDHLVDTLAAAGVDTSLVARDPQARTGLAFVSRHEGDREFLFYRHPAADQRLRVDEVDAERIRRAEVLHFGSVSLPVSPAREATLHAVAVAGSAGVLRSLDVNLRLEGWGSAGEARAAILAAAATSEVVKVSEEELDFLAGGRDEAGATALLRGATGLLVVTRGAAGASYYLATGDGLAAGHVAGFAVAALDTTGAGDAFVAGLLTGILADRNALTDRGALEAVLRRANACGALATTRLGAIPALPTATELAAFLAGASVTPA